MSRAPASTNSARPRLDGVDLLRGLVMVVMALDHARDFFSPTLGPGGGLVSPEQLPDPGAALFFTRWVTHFCAPVFVFLAGAGAFLYGSRGRSRSEVARFLVTRGLWLVVLEFTVVQFGWLFSLSAGFLIAQVIWAIGVSMIALAGLVLLPVPVQVVAGVGLALVAGHNLFDDTALELAVAGGNPAHFGLIESLWAVLHVRGFVLLGSGGFGMAILYPVLPWIGVMALGWVFGRVLLWPEARRLRMCLLLGALAVVAFLGLRAGNVYGDPWPWEQQGSAVATLIDFLNCQKYPPSLLFLLMTLGPALLVLPGLERLAKTGWVRPLVTIGRVPLLYYVAHIYLLHGLAVAWGVARFGDQAWGWSVLGGHLPEYDLGLWVAYLAWALSVVALYPLCRWFAGVKARSRSPWLSYL